ncbi:hypothetical protein MNBD_GAMMA21-1026 [hydrothermal vent metagenome]|uniref:Uncharacterized protein n=1 Tax=hydrothermal vent metagenome TaxID=652676 RepID=A0A3B0ZXG8_9ZZZZ
MTESLQKGESRFVLSFIDKISMPHVLGFIRSKLTNYDTQLVEWIKLLPLNKKAILHGCCSYPIRVKPRSRRYKQGYRLRASVNVELAPPYTYMHWGRIPSSNYKQGWYSGAMDFRFDDLDECAVHTLAHECFHFLSHSKQVKYKNTEANANWWADQWTQEFKQDQSDLPSGDI